MVLSTTSTILYFIERDLSYLIAEEVKNAELELTYQQGRANDSHLFIQQLLVLPSCSTRLVTLACSSFMLSLNFHGQDQARFNPESSPPAPSGRRPCAPQLQPLHVHVSLKLLLPGSPAFHFSHRLDDCDVVLILPHKRQAHGGWG
jgi:hypothetical protein